MLELEGRHVKTARSVLENGGDASVQGRGQWNTENVAAALRKHAINLCALERVLGETARETSIPRSEIWATWSKARRLERARRIWAPEEGARRTAYVEARRQQLNDVCHLLNANVLVSTELAAALIKGKRRPLIDYISAELGTLPTGIAAFITSFLTSFLPNPPPVTAEEIDEFFENRAPDFLQKSEHLRRTIAKADVVGLDNLELWEKRRRNRWLLAARFPEAFWNPTHTLRRIVIEKDQASRLQIFGFALSVFLLFGLWVDVNRTSMHHFYRNKLAGAFLVPNKGLLGRICG